MRHLLSRIITLVPEQKSKNPEWTGLVVCGAFVLLVLIVLGWIVAETIFAMRIPSVVVIVAIVAVILGTSLLLNPPVMWMKTVRESGGKKRSPP